VITVYDNTPPVVQNCPANITVSPTTLAGTIVTYTTPTATDNCGGTPTRNQTSGMPSGSRFPIGTTTNTYEFTDACGNKSTCNFTVTVIDPYCDKNPKNRKAYVCHNGNTICVDERSVQGHLDHGDYLGQCATSQSSSQSTQIVQQNSTIAMPDQASVFNVIFAPNPSTTDFRLKVESSSNGLINIRVVDLSGRVMSVISGVRKDAPVIFGGNYRDGVYFAEVIQGGNSKTVKLIKLR
jgi:hypothetical protein